MLNVNMHPSVQSKPKPANYNRKHAPAVAAAGCRQGAAVTAQRCPEQVLLRTSLPTDKRLQRMPVSTSVALSSDKIVIYEDPQPGNKAAFPCATGWLRPARCSYEGAAAADLLQCRGIR